VDHAPNCRENPGVRVFRIPFSTNVERMALALGHKGLACEWVDLDPADRDPVVRLSGQTLVPVLDDDGHVVVDSTRIVRYLDERFPERPLYPRDEPRRTHVWIFVEWFDKVWKRPPNELADELEKPAPDPARVEALAAELGEALDVFERLLAGGPYLYGDDFTAADLTAFPFLKYALLHDPDDDELFHRVLMEHQPLTSHPRLVEWIARVDAHPRA
jgi:glutathione S-transferase